jgi:opacity protein-like surface antigen
MKRTMMSAAMLLSLAASAQDTTSNTQPQSSGALNFNGFVEGYYSYDLNQPKNNKKPAFLYSHNRHNEFTINLAFVRGSYTKERGRANLAVAVGTYMNANYAAEPGVLKNIYEADAGYKLNRNKNLWFDIGIMPSHIGFETAHSPSCWTLTRSLGADNSPYFESGAKLTYTTNNGKWVLSAMALNGWQRIQRLDGNSLMSWGTQVYFKPSGKVLLNYSTFLGTDKPDTARLWRNFHDMYGIFQITDKIGFIAGFDIGMEQKTMNGKDCYTWYTPIGILRYTPDNKWAVALRIEYYSDEHGVIIGTGTQNGFKTIGGSTNVDYLPMKNVALRLEARHLDSKDAIFAKEGTAKNKNTAITFSTAISF